MEMPVEKPNVIDDGKHQGRIVDVIYREEPYKYTDIVIEFEGLNLKAGYPTKMMETSLLGELLKRFGMVVAVGMTADPDKLKGRMCEFITMTELKNNKSYAKIIPASVKPLGEEIHKRAEAELKKEELTTSPAIPVI